MVCLILSLTITSAAQLNTSGEVYVQSWRRGERKIQPQKMLIELNRDHLAHEQVLLDAGGIPRFILQVRHSPWNKKFNAYYESWWVDLCDYRGQKRRLDVSKECLLLTSSGRGPGGDYFPKEDSVGRLYPLEEHQQEIMKKVSNAYPLYAKRVVKVEGFYCIIQVKRHKMSQINPMMMDSLSVEIELTNDSSVFKGAI
jgi:hypothetical protein